MKQLLISVIIISGIILGYGYWHSITHATTHIDLKFDMEKRQLSKAEVFFMDLNANVLARGVRDEKYNHVYLIHPEVGNCNQLSKGPSNNETRKLWLECFEIRSIWIPTWIKKVRQVQVKHENCLSKKIPIIISEYNSEWLLWWVPLPHVGGIPYSYFRARIVIDERDCIE